MKTSSLKLAISLLFISVFAVAAYANSCSVDPSQPVCAPSFSLTWHLQGSGQQHSAQTLGPAWTGSSWLVNYVPQVGNGYYFTGGQLVSSPDPFLSYSFGVVNTSTHNMVFNFDYTTTFNTGGYPIVAAEDFFFDGLQYTGHSAGSTSVTPNPANGYYNFLQTSLVDGVVIPNFQLGLGCTAPKGAPCISAGPYDVLEAYSHSDTGTLEIKGQFTLGPNANYTISGETDLFAAVPEPGSLLLLGTGILGLASVIRRKVNS